MTRGRGLIETRRSRGLLAGLRGFLARVVIQDALPETQALRRDFHELVRGDVFDRAFKRELRRRRETGGDTGTLRAEVGERLFADGVTGDVFVTRIFADDHAFVNLLAGAHEELAALLHH